MSDNNTYGDISIEDRIPAVKSIKDSAKGIANYFGAALDATIDIPCLSKNPFEILACILCGAIYSATNANDRFPIIGPCGPPNGGICSTPPRPGDLPGLPELPPGLGDDLYDPLYPPRPQNTFAICCTGWSPFSPLNNNDIDIPLVPPTGDGTPIDGVPPLSGDFPALSGDFPALSGDFPALSGGFPTLSGGNPPVKLKHPNPLPKWGFEKSEELPEYRKKPKRDIKTPIDCPPKMDDNCETFTF